MDNQAPAQCAPPDLNLIAPNFKLPAGAIDTHAHVFDSHFPLSPNRSYSPAMASKQKYFDLLKCLGFSRAVLVQPSVYGLDNSAILDCMADTTSGLEFRGVAVISDEQLSSQYLNNLHQQGIRGVRLNLLFKGGLSKDQISLIASKIADYNWHFQLLVNVAEFEEIDLFAKNLPLDIVIDHFGHMPVNLGINHPGFQSLLRALDGGKTWLKLSGAYRLTQERKPPYSDVEVFAKMLINTNIERMLYGTDWPHPSINIPMPNDADLLNNFYSWLEGDNELEQILVKNPFKLYQF